MYKVKVNNACRCFLRSGLSEQLEFTTQDDVKKEAENMLQTMNSNFCHKHDFVLDEKFGDYIIYIKPSA